jgi:hypothetical protein
MVFVANAGAGSVSLVSDSANTSVSPSPTVPEFSFAGLISLFALMVAVTIGTVVVIERKTKKSV